MKQFQTTNHVSARQGNLNRSKHALLKLLSLGFVTGAILMTLFIAPDITHAGCSGADGHCSISIIQPLLPTA